MLAVYEAAKTAVGECRAGEGPVLLELLTYRRTGHSRRDPCHYQPKDEREAWAAEGPDRSIRRSVEEPGHHRRRGPGSDQDATFFAGSTRRWKSQSASRSDAGRLDHRRICLNARNYAFVHAPGAVMGGSATATTLNRHHFDMSLEKR